MIEIPILDLHITHACNLTCESCSDFTNHKLIGMLSLQDAEEWMSNWNKKLKPKQFILLGGEPTLNKDLVEFLYLSRQMWRETQLILVSNGFFLHLHPNLGKDLKNNDVELAISIHDTSKEYLNKIKSNLTLSREWVQKYNTKVRIISSHKKWRPIYKGYGANIMPFEDNDPESSWKNCYMKEWEDDGHCYQLHEGKIWKCPPIAYLPLMAKKYNLSEKWDPYLKYQPLTPNCSDEELTKFFSKGAESICGMCPAKKIYMENSKNPLLSEKESIEYFSKLL
jgi:organic radical activating enzyme